MAENPYFDQQRALLINDVAAQSLENVLQNINKLNRSLEGVIAVGNEFSQVEGLWSQFEHVMAHAAPEDPPETKGGAAAAEDQEKTSS
ncbi:DASH complex subunit Dad1 like protein [Teratosphaeria destructans]|uniref:DASH complex subunit DAD1 n=1 Tax=Teratosphaeria destructans TaxID=418781 RepID=A0A9W7SKV2_9PEZI|nr:DASH complex subunit Dad1 like protein [Teratosphaeria destructans]